MSKIKWLLLGVVVSGLIVAYFYVPSIEELQQLKPSPAIFVLGYAILTIMGVPGTPLSILGGSIFGNWMGIAWVLLGANLGANLAFFTARFLARDLVTSLVERKFPRFNRSLEESGFLWMLSLRLLPIFPYFAVNYAAGVSPIGWRDYFLATLIGMVPAAVGFVSLGATLGRAASGVGLSDPRLWKDPGMWVSLGLVCAAAIFMWWMRKRRPEM